MAACSDSGSEATTTTAPPPAPTTAVTATTAPEATVSTATTAADVDQLPGFDRQRVIVGDEAWLVAVAATGEQRALGLMGVTDLGDVDGMLFVYESDSRGGFWMKDTLIPLDIAFFDGDGALVDLLSMVPCEEDPCLVYTPSGAYRFALESLPGRLDGLAEAPTLDFGTKQQGRDKNA